MPDGDFAGADSAGVDIAGADIAGAEIAGVDIAGADFAGRMVIVIGAAGALGAGLVTAFTEAGATVNGVDKAVPAADRRLDGVSYQAVNAADDAALGALFEQGAPPWAVVNAVGGFAPYAPLAELDPAVLSGQLELNLISAALVTKHALRRMATAGQGRIVHTASRAAVVTKGSNFAYSVSKLGVLHLVSMAADEAKGTGITVNCVVPSIIDTPANRSAMPNAEHASWPKIPDIARAYVFLASPAARLVSGAALPV
ncbi:MAG TPA: SDR family oxidoreductase [Streptosporangiaceae bacterium]|nr:SDR family oxidoreductase [Streptosporangiaceae bacterium]